MKRGSSDYSSKTDEPLTFSDLNTRMHEGPMRNTITLLICLLNVGGCSTYRGSEMEHGITGPLPDLRIKKIEYQAMNRQQLVKRLRGETLNYEFKVFVENLGDAPMSDVFYFSISGTTADFQDHLYTHHVRVNDVGNIINPGENVAFIIQINIEPPPPNIRNYRYPIRFYLNTEGTNNTVGYPTNFIAEKTYRNNYYELSMRIKSY
jgi:hypothetical protein